MTNDHCSRSSVRAIKQKYLMFIFLVQLFLDNFFLVIAKVIYQIQRLDQANCIELIIFFIII